jgi:branched-chain amino acid transport system ATP-binding protein
LLSLDGLCAGYGDAQVLDHVSLQVEEGQIATLVGRNGAGKTTLLRCLMGLHRPTAGSIAFAGADVTRRSPHQRARLGLGYVPDDRGIYATLTVEENLLLPPAVHERAWPMEQVYEAFPVLADRRKQVGTHLSGGEQQMLSLARVLRTGARMLLADEPTEGLSPLLVQQIGDILRSVKEHGVTVLLIEQNARVALSVCDRGYIMEKGVIVFEASSRELRDSPVTREKLGV